MLKIRTHEALDGDEVTVALWIGDTPAKCRLAGALHLDVDVYEGLLRRLDHWPHTIVERGPCGRCGHSSHLLDDCEAALFDEAGPASCTCGQVDPDVPTHPETLTETVEADLRADAGAGR